MTQVMVEVLKVETDEVVRSLGPMDERKADRVERGLLINMNHEHYYTRIRDAEERSQRVKRSETETS